MSKENSKKSGGITMNVAANEHAPSSTTKSESLESNPDSTPSKEVMKVESVKELYEKYKKEVSIAGFEYIPNTPFSILNIQYLETGKIKHLISCGAEVVCDKIFTAKEEAIEYIKEPKWDIIWNVTNLLLATSKQKENE